MDWITDNRVEIFGAAAGIIYIFLEIRQNIWLWPVGIVTSAVYILVFFNGKLYAEMSLQGYYVVISCFGWYWWTRANGRQLPGDRQEADGTVQSSSFEGGKGDVVRGKGQERERERIGEGARGRLQVTRLILRTGVTLAAVYVLLHSAMWLMLAAFTDSPVPGWDSFITSLSIIATWMLARKIWEHWFLWIAVNSASVILFVNRGLYPTSILYLIYCIMAFAGLTEWKKSIDYKKAGDLSDIK